MKISHNIFVFSSVLALSLPTGFKIVNADTNSNSTNTNATTQNVNDQKLTMQTQLTQSNNQTVNQQPPANGFTPLQNGNATTTDTNQTTNSNQATATSSSSASSSTSSSSSSSSSNYYNDYGFAHWTRYDLEHMQDGIKTVQQNPIGDLSKSKIADLPSAIDMRRAFKGQKMNVWDSWPLQDANGNEVTYHGYHLTFALAGNPKADYTLLSGQKIQDTHIFLFYQKVKDQKQGVNSWKNAGQVFLTPTEGSDDQDATLNTQLAQWSGQSILTSQNQIRMFYTSFNGSKDTNWQALATAQLSITANKNGVSINHDQTSDNKFIATADGVNYQTLSQAKDDGYDENVFRDPHFFSYDGKNYLTFAANSTTQNGPEGTTALYNTAYLGGNSAFQKSQQDLLLPSVNNPWHLPGTDYNAVMGVSELNDDYTVKKMMKPLIGFNTVSDELERPDIFEHNGKWYLFGITRGYKLATPNVHNTNSFLVGFVSDSPFGKWKPLNRHGLVVRNTRAWNSRKYTYSFYVLNNQSKDNRLVMTSYATNAKLKVGHQTFGPSMVIDLNGSKAKVEKKVLNQGQLVK